ncbi:LysR family transcriptional regulator [Caproiciproducens sp. MSJ-32]|uniref:LysR family transcriptional regulator n=1 Tax=Caproiciproducens sp. MSJ-32 TaxID=2841527 RepID=UPI001C10C195|nr:LysR family transcriptional regulator [Caproiciproducens sp. MSJ-32]MBU5455034.1 LysR family transcriptional regulator [Caproiciproducens sp. MSJ-32]
MNIDSLNYFYEVAKAKSISSIAKNFHISQSALSQQISKLENYLGIKLFDRSNKGVTLTDEGEILFKYAEVIIGTVNRMHQELYDYINKKKSVNIDCIEPLSYKILSSTLPKLKDKFPTYKINLNIISDSYINKGDISLSYKKTPKEEGMITKLIGYDEIILISNVNFNKSSIKAEDLLELPLILVDYKNIIDNTILDKLGYTTNDLEKFNLLFSTNSFLAAVNGVINSDALTFVPKTIYKDFNDPMLKRINIEDFSTSLPVYISYSASYYQINSDFIRSFKNSIKKYLNN